MSRLRSLSNPESVAPWVLHAKSTQLQQAHINCHGFSFRFGPFDVHYACHSQMFWITMFHNGQPHSLGGSIGVTVEAFEKVLMTGGLLLDLGHFEATVRQDNCNSILFLARNHSEQTWTELGDVPWFLYVRFLRVASKIYSTCCSSGDSLTAMRARGTFTGTLSLVSFLTLFHTWSNARCTSDSNGSPSRASVVARSTVCFST